MEEELVSVVVPIYNVEQYLSRCIETITAQTYRNLEIILVDDGATDGSGRICDAFAKRDNRVKCVHQGNLGPGAARNAGKRLAHGEYIMFVDGDDYLHHDAVKVMYEAINRDVGYDMAIAKYRATRSLSEDVVHTVNGQCSTITNIEILEYLTGERICNDASPNKIIHSNVWGKLFKRKLIEDIWFKDYPLAEDLDFMIRVCNAVQQAVIVDSALSYYVQRKGSLMTQKRRYDIDQQCVVNLLYNNYMALPENRTDFRCVLLRRLYKKIVFLKARMLETDEQEKFFGLCREYMRATRMDYWLSMRINPIEKVVVTFLINCPSLARWLMKKTNNWAPQE